MRKFRTRTILIQAKSIVRGIVLLMTLIGFLSVLTARHEAIGQSLTNMLFGSEGVCRNYIEQTLRFASYRQEEGYLDRLDRFCVQVLGFSIQSPLSIIDSQIAFAAQVDKSRFEKLAGTEEPDVDDQAELPPESSEPKLTEPKKVQSETIDSDGRMLTNHTEIDVDINALLQRPISFEADPGAYRVLILHTHATESYLPTDRNENDEENVVKVGAVLTEQLNAHGIGTLHIATHHDVPSFNGSYKKSAESVAACLQKYPGIEIVIDLHRDAVAETSAGKLSLEAEIAGVKAAQVMLVVGTNAGGLEHPNWEQNLGFALQLQQMLNQKFPGLTRPVDLRTERFNQNLLDKYVIIEVGANGNNLSDALYSAELLAKGIADLVQHNIR